MTEPFFPATAMPDRDWWAALWPEPDAVIRRVGVKAGMKILDLCCGDGYFTAPMAKLANTTVYALDIDPAMLEAARQEAARQDASVAEWICADARDLPALVPLDLDFVLMANTFHGVQHPTDLARAVSRVLRPGGRFCVVNWNALPREQTSVLGQPRGPKTEMRMSPKDVRVAVEPVGLAFESLIELPPFHYAAIFENATDQR